MDVVGVDACPGGWVGVVLSEGRFAAAKVGRTLGELLERAPGAEVVAVDIPLGLLEAGWRQADKLARARLGAQRSSVFLVPPRTVWNESGYERANRLCKEVTGSGMSVQAWGLAPKLREAAECRKRDRRLYEVHPEVCFAQMAGGAPVAWRKKSWNGQAERRRLLRGCGVDLPDVLDGAGRTPPDDILDAAAAAWTAHRIATGRAGSLPDPPETTADGLPVAIWY